MSTVGTEIAERDEKAIAEVAVRFARMVAKSVEVMETVDRTYELPRDVDGSLVRPAGMSEPEFNLHKDSMLPAKQVPFYLASHRTRIETAQKIAGDRASAPQEIARRVVKVLELPKRDYEVIDVTINEKT